MLRRRRESPVVRRATAVATACFLANCAFGAAVGSGLLRTGRFRWVHHALYVVTCSTSAGAFVAAVAARSAVAAALAPAALPLAVIPYAGSRPRRHVPVALSAAPFFLSAFRRSRS